VEHTPATYGKDYQYPGWAQIVGICLSLSSMLWIPIYAVYFLLTGPGTIKQVQIIVTFKRWIDVIVTDKGKEFLVVFLYHQSSNQAGTIDSVKCFRLLNHWSKIFYCYCYFIAEFIGGAKTEI